MTYISNKEIADILNEMAALYEIEGVEFKPRAYERAALAIESLQESVTELYKKGGGEALHSIPGVGAGIAAHIESLLKKGRFAEYDRLKRKTPVRIGELMAVEGIGPRTIKVLYQKLKIKTLKDLERAARNGEIRTLPGFGEKSEQKIITGIEFLKVSAGRELLGIVLSTARELEKKIKSFPEVKEAVVSGSLIRRKETIGDIDMLVVSSDSEATIDKLLKFPVISHVYGHGSTKTNVRLTIGLDMDVRVIPPESFGAALNYFTGSKAHNIALREIAIKKGWKLNEYGLFKGKLRIAGRKEEDIYEKLELAFIPPELREMTGEIEAARREYEGRKPGLPQLIGYKDLKGDLQMHTKWSDGRSTIEEMARAAEKEGLQYIAITDHTHSLAMAGGLDGGDLRRQRREIDLINQKLSKEGSKMKVIQGAEVNIGKDGSLDLPDEVLKELDMVGAAVHSYFGLPRSVQTKRLIRVIENKHVDILFHPTARLVKSRKGIEADWDEVIAAAKRSGTILEVDASPERLDLPDELIRRAVEAEVPLVIDSDSHSPLGFHTLELGIAQARRGWAEKSDILNTAPLERFLERLKKPQTR